MYNRANAGTGDTGTINSNDRIAVTVYSLGTWFVSGIYVLINTLHKGAKDDDDDEDNNNDNNNNNGTLILLIVLSTAEYNITTSLRPKGIY
jgi:hypothetical protein